MNTQDLIAFLNRKSRHQATLASQATTSEVAFIHEDEAKRFAECADRLTTVTSLLGECEVWVTPGFSHHCRCDCGQCTLLTRIREATKGKT